MGRHRPTPRPDKLRGDIRDVVKFAQAHGYTLHAGRKHYQLRKPGFPPLDVPFTPSDWRTARNLTAQVRRAVRQEGEETA